MKISEYNFQSLVKVVEDIIKDIDKDKFIDLFTEMYNFIDSLTLFRTISYL